MPTKKGGSGLVFSSDSLKEFLGSSSKAGVSKKRTQILAAEQSNAIVKEILREESLDQTSRLRGKKKFSSKSLSSPKEINRYDNEERIRKDESKKVGNNAVLSYNVHTFGSALGLVGDDVYYLEKLYLRIKGILESYTEKLIAGYEQLISDGGEFSVSNAELLLAFAEIEVEDVVFHSISGQLTPSRVGKKVENNDESITLDFDKWLVYIISNARRRLMTCALGSKYGHSAPTYLDRIDNYNPMNFLTASIIGRISGSGKEQINNIVLRTARGNTKDGAALREGSSNRPSPLKSNDRGLDFTSSYFLKTFSSTMDVPTLGSDSSSYGEDGDGDTYEAGMLGSTNGRSDVGVVDDVHSMFDDQKYTEQSLGSRPSSPVRRHTMNNEFEKNLKADWSRIVASRSATSMVFPAMALKGPLAPVRAQQMKSKAAQKRMLLNNGFNESFGRATPRCLKNDQLGQASSFNGIGNTGMLDGYRSFGGSGRDGDAPLTDAKSIMDNVENLKKELALAEAGVKYLDNRVDEDIVWVHSQCDIPVGTNTMSVRTQSRCRKLSVEKIVMVFSGYAQNTLYWALMKWRESSNYDRLKVTTTLYSRAKGIELLCKSTHSAVCRQLLKGWVPWVEGVKAQKRAERNKAATQICRIARGYIGRNAAKNLRFYRASVIIQRVVRIFLSRKSSELQRQRFASGQEKPRQSRPVEDESMESAADRSSRHRTQGEAKDEREERRRVYAIERAVLRADAASRDGETHRDQSKEESSEAKGRSYRVKRDSVASAKQTVRQDQAVTPNDRPFTTNMKTEAELGRESVEVGAARVRERNKLLQDKERERAKKKQAKEDTARIRLEKKDEVDHSRSSAAVTIQRVVRGMLAGTLGSQEVVVEAARNLGTDTESVSTALLKKKSGSYSKLSSGDNSVRSNRSRSNSNSSSSSSASKRKSFIGISDLPTSQSTTPDDAKISFFPNIVEKISTKKLSDVREEELVPSPEGRDFDPEMSSEKVGGETEGNKGSDRGSDMENGTVEERERRIRRVLSDSSKEDNTRAHRKGPEIDTIPSPSHHKSPNSTSKIQLKGGLRSKSQRRSLPSLAGHKNTSIINTKKSVRNDPISVHSILDVPHTSGRGKADVLEKEPKDTFNSSSSNTNSKRNSLSNELKSRKKSASCTGEFATPHSLGIPYARSGLGRPCSTNALKIPTSSLPPVPSPKFAKSSKFVHSIRSMTPPAPLGMVEDESPESVEGKKRVMSPNTVNTADVELMNAPHTFDSNITPITDLSCFMGGCETTSASLNTMDTLTPGCGYIALLTQSSTITTEQFRALDRESRLAEMGSTVSDATGSQYPESSQGTDTDVNETPRRLEEFKHIGREEVVAEVEFQEPDSESIVHDEPDGAVDAEQFAEAEYTPARLDNSSSSSANASSRSMIGQEAGSENENAVSCEQTPSSSRRQSEADAADADREEEDRQREVDEENEKERERIEDLRQRDEASARQREEEEEEERRKNEAEEEAEKERERIKALKLRIEASAAARRKEKEEDAERERERERLEDLRRQEEASIAARMREEEEDRLREEEEERERERERLEDLHQQELEAIAARQREEEERKKEEEERRKEEEERIKKEEEDAAEKEQVRKRDLKLRMEASIAAKRKEKVEEEERRKTEEMEGIQRESERLEDLKIREEASLQARQREEEEDFKRREEEEEERERERERLEDLRQQELALIAERKEEKEQEEEQRRRDEGGEEKLESQRVEDLHQLNLASTAARRREEEREREIIEDQRIRDRISDNKLNLTKAQDLEREKLRETERLREEALKAQKEKGNFGIVKGIAAILKHDKGKNTIESKSSDKDCDKDKGSEVMPTKNASEINEEDVMLLARQLSYGKVRPNRSRRVSAARIAAPKGLPQQSLEGSVRKPQPPDDGNPGRPRPPDDIGGRRKTSDDVSIKKMNLAEDPVCVRARMRSEDSLPSMSKPPLHSDDCSSIGSRRRRSSSISPLLKNSPKPNAGESAVDEKIRLLDEKLQKLEAVEKRVEERERAMEIARKVTENKALALEIRMLEFEERNRLSACAMGSEPIPSDLGSVRSSFPRGERTPFDRNMSFSEGPASSTSATRYYRMSSNHSGFASSSSHSRDRADGSRRHTPRKSQVPAPAFGLFPHLLPVPQGLPRCTHEGIEWVFLHDNITNKSFWFCESTTLTQWMKPGLNLKMEIDTSTSDDRSGVCRSISAFEEEDHGYLTDNASVMTDCTSDSNNNSQNGSEAGDELPEWQEFWDEQAQGKYWYNNISGEASWTKPFSDQFDSGTNTTPVGGMDPDNLDWISSIDDSTGQEYWYNVKTGESSWA